MAKYKSAVYGVTTYGENDPNVVPYDSAIEATQSAYGTARVSWLTVSPAAGEDNPTYFKLIKSTGGAPDDPSLGETVLEGKFPSPTLSYIDPDTSMYPSGTQLTYSYWVLVNTTNVWRFCGSAEITVTADDSDTTYKLMSLLPQTWVNNNGLVGDATGTPDIPPNNQRPYDSGGHPDHKYDLWALLHSFSFYYDKLRNEISAFRDASDYFSYPRKLLSTAIDELQFSTEPSLGDNYHRTLYQQGNLINSLRGTKLGVEIFGSALTHTKVKATMGKNLMLDYNDSSFEESIGSWKAQSTIAVSTRAFSEGQATIVTGVAHKLAVGDTVTVAMSSDIFVALEETTSTSSGITLKWQTYNSSHVAADPTAVTLSITLPNGTVVTPTVTKTSTGNYSAAYTITMVGIHNYTWNGTGTNAQSYSSQFTSRNLYSGTYVVTAVNSTTSFSYTRNFGTITQSATSATGTVVFYPAVLSANKYANSITDLSLSQLLVPPSPRGAYQVRTSGFGLITALGDGTILLSSWGNSPITRGIPVVAGEYYHFCGYVQGYSATGAIRTRVVWFDKNGTRLTDVSWGSSVGLSIAWQYFDASETAADCLAPAAAVYAGVEIELSSMSDGTQSYIDMLNFSTFPGRVGDTSYGFGETAYEDARTVRVQMAGSRTNYIHNPLFEDSTIGWTTKNATLAKSADQAFLGTNSGKVTLSASTGYLVSEWMKSEDEQYYTASIYVRGTGSAKLSLEFTSPLAAADQAALLKEGSTAGSNLKRYYTSNFHKVTSDSVTLSNSSWTRITVTAKAPDMYVETPEALMKISLEINGTNGNSYYVDCAMLEDSSYAGPFFSGSGIFEPTIYQTNYDKWVAGGSVGAAPARNDYVVSLPDCRWENRTTMNFISNPSFESNVTGWTSGNTTSFASFVPTTGTPAAGYGAKIGKIVPSAANSYISNAFYFPKRTTATFPQGGEEVTAAIDVAGGAGTYTIRLTDSAGTYTENSFVLPAATTWTRIFVTGLTLPNAESMTVKITYSGTDTWYVDGAQAEFGHIPTKFIVPHSAYTVTMRIVSGGTPGTADMYTENRDLVNSGRSYYWPNFDSKSSRLSLEVPNVLVAGSSSVIDLGEPEKVFPDMPFSLLKSTSFEASLYGWTAGANTTITRVLGKGSVFGDYAAVGGHWNKMSNTSAQTMSMSQGPFLIDQGRYYDISAAFKITDASFAGTASVSVTWFNSSGSQVGDVTTMSLAIASTGKWYYVGNLNLAGSNKTVSPPTNAASATIALSYDPTASSGAQSVLVDRVVFRPALY